MLTTSPCSVVGGMRFKLQLDRIEEPSYDDLVAQTSLLSKQLYCLRQATQKVLCVYDKQHTRGNPETGRPDAYWHKPVPGFSVSFFTASTDAATPLWIQCTLELVVWEHTGDKEVWASVVLDDNGTHRQATLLSVRIADGIIPRMQKGTDPHTCTQSIQCYLTTSRSCYVTWIRARCCRAARHAHSIRMAQVQLSPLDRHHQRAARDVPAQTVLAPYRNHVLTHPMFVMS